MSIGIVNRQPFRRARCEQVRVSGDEHKQRKVSCDAATVGVKCRGKLYGVVATQSMILRQSHRLDDQGRRNLNRAQPVRIIVLKRTDGACSIGSR